VKYKYSRYVEDALDSIDLESLVSQLSDLLLSSGFNNPWDPQNDDDQTLQALHDAILDALLNGGALSDEMLDKLTSQQTGKAGEDARDQLEQLVQRIIERMTEQGYVSVTGQPGTQKLDGMRGSDAGVADGTTRFQLTDKAIDFLGYRALRDLLGSMGRSSAGRHETREQAPGIESGGPPRAYEFGDSLNLDATATVLSAVRRKSIDRSDRAPGSAASALGIEIDYEDLMVAQGDQKALKELSTG
jgi:Ca-activated chloride channel family protein